MTDEQKKKSEDDKIREIQELAEADFSDEESSKDEDLEDEVAVQENDTKE
jgi:hypothetical protein